MKVLWFSLSPCGSIRRNNTVKYNQGWMISLEDEVKKCAEVDLHVCFISEFYENDFYFEGVNYHPIIRKTAKNGIMRVLNRFHFSLLDDNARMLSQLVDVVNKVAPDLIHIHGTEECFGLIQDVITEIPIVFSIQGLIAPYAEKYYSGFPYEIVRKHEPLKIKYLGLGTKQVYKKFINRGKRELHYLQNAKYVIGRTFFDHFIPQLCNPKVKLFQGEEILRREFYLNQWNKNEFGTPLKIVSTISGGIYKGYETVLHTASLLKQYAKLDFEWYVIGYDCRSQWVNTAEKYKKLLSVDSNIKLLGKKTSLEMVDIMTDCDIYVHVSHIENSPNSVCEAMLLGMPIIASFAGGTSSLLKNEEEGILVQDGDPYVLGGAIVNLYLNFDKAKKMGMKSRERALKRHNPKMIRQSLISIYNKILSEQYE